jgi:uncharacterized protein YbaP (TraB family)
VHRDALELEHHRARELDAGARLDARELLDRRRVGPRVPDRGVARDRLDPRRERARIARGPGLDQLLATDDWWDLRDALRDRIREDDLKRARPWYALILLSRRAAGKVVAMDTELATKARAQHVPIDGLETWDAQLTALDATVTVDDLTQAIHGRDALRCSFRGLRAMYDAGDLAVMESLLVVPRTAERMLYARNRAWLPKLEHDLSDGGAFVAVGLGHMIGDHGLPALLARAGFDVQRVRTR